MTAVLVVAGVDSSGGAGLLRDTRTLVDLEVEPLCAVTAVTAQSDSGVLALHHVPAAIITEQIQAAFAHPRLAAVKIGMLGTATTVVAVVCGLQKGLAGRGAGNGVPIVLDPVLHASSGGALLDARGRRAMLDRLFPIATLVTPNLPEAAALLDCAPAHDETDVVAQAARLLAFGPAAILLKGGHGTGTDAVDHLVSRSDAFEPTCGVVGSPTSAPSSSIVRRLALPRVSSTHRGTGCALASAIAARMALGLSLEEACFEAKKYVHSVLLRKPSPPR